MRQRGRNEKYPNEIKVWRLGEPIPTWLSDVAKVKDVKGDGSMIIDIRMVDNDRGFEIIKPDNQILVRTNKNSDIICFGNKQFFVLTEKQLDLLYYE